MKHGLVAAARQGVRTAPIQMGPKGGKFYFNAQGHKVYGTPPAPGARPSQAGGSGAARYTTQLGRAAHSARPNRESLSKRLGKRAQQIKERDGHRCVYCRRTAEQSGAHLHLDHLTPKAHGGKDVPKNLVLACRSCNSRRQDRSLSEWAKAARASDPKLKFTAAGIRAQANKKLPDI